MADTMGVSRATLINYEKGHTSINVDVLERLKNAYPILELDDQKTQKPQIIKVNIINFKVLYDVLHEGSRYIFLFTFFIMLIGVGSSFLFTKFYSAEISLYPAKKDMMQGLGQFQSLAMNLGMNTPKNDQNFNIPDVVKSRLIANKAINQKWMTENGEKIKLIDLWKINKSSLFSIFNSNTIDSLYIKEKAIKKFNSHISVIEDRLSGLIRITTTLEDPIIAAGVANFIGKEVQLYIQKENSAQSTKEKLFISERVAIVKKELEFSELSLKDFKERNRGYEDSPELFMIFSQLYREVEAKKEVYLTLQQQLELARIEEVKQTPILHILDPAFVPSRKSSPNRLIFLIGSMLLGFMSSSIITIFRY